MKSDWLLCIIAASLAALDLVAWCTARYWKRRVELHPDSHLQRENDVILSIAIEEKKATNATLSEGLYFEEQVPAHAIYGAILTAAIPLLLLLRSFFAQSAHRWIVFAVTIIYMYHCQITVLSKPYPRALRALGHAAFDVGLALVLALDLRYHKRFYDSIKMRSILGLAILFVLLHLATVLTKPLSPRNRLFAPTAPPELAGTSIFSLSTCIFLNKYVAEAAKGAARITELRPEANAATALHDFRTLSAAHPNLGFKLRFVLYLGPPLLQQQLLGVAAALSNVMMPIFLKKLLHWLSDRQNGHIEDAILYAVGIAAFNALYCLCGNRALFVGRQMSVLVRAVLGGELFTKTLRRQDLSRPESTDEAPQDISSSGKINNLISSDVYKISETVCYIYMFFPTGVLIISIGVFLLFKLLGLSAIAALIVIIIQAPIVSGFGYMYSHCSDKVLKATDARLHLTQEIIQAIRIVKSFAWQERFAQRLDEKRNIELKWLRRRLISQIGFLCTYLSGSISIALVTFWTHSILLGRPLDATTAFTAMSLFQIIRAPMDQASSMAVDMLASNVSLTRIVNYLNEPDTEKWSILHKGGEEAADSQRIGFEDAIFDWGGDSGEDNFFSLGPLDVSFPPGKLSIISGSVGSGKSTLLLSLLGETKLVKGKVFLPAPLFRPTNKSADLVDAVAYCSQSPYLLSDSVRNNILFGLPYNKTRYQQTIAACALTPDLKSLDSGDQTEVGERGTVLSGGQKARIALARALYSNARCLLLDDVIAAVDAHTAQHLVRSLTGPLLEGRTCLLVTHALQLFAPVAQHIVALEDGQVLYSGDQIKTAIDLLGLPSEAQFDSPSEAHTHAVNVGKDSTPLEALPDVADVQENKKPENLEEQATGAVSHEVYKQYFRDAGGAVVVASIVGLFVLSQTAEILTNAWLRRWASSFSTPPQAPHFQATLRRPWAIDVDQFTPLQFFYGYLVLCLLTVSLYVARTWWILTNGIRAAKSTYERLISSILGAQIRFFDVTPTGRIINRLSRDTKIIDETIIDKASYLLLEIVFTLGIVVVVAINVPLILLLVAGITYYFWNATIVFIRGAREMRRTESTTRSPIFSLFGETYVGITTIRAFSDTGRFLKIMLDLQNINSRPFYDLWLANRWLSVQTNLAGSCFMFFVALLIILTPSMTAAFAGFCLTYASLLQERLMWLTRMTADLEIDANSLERAREYSTLEQERVDGIRPPPQWPSETGRIDVKALTVRYGSGQSPVLDSVSFSIEPRNKVAVVGRTGAGKSTLANSFFRFVEFESGQIEIDGIDISTVAIHELRRRLTIIPQEATLFAGTIRFNLDPFEEHDDVTLWDALRRVNLVSQTPLPSRAPSRAHSRNPSRVPSKTDLQSGEIFDSTTLVGEETKTVIKSLDQEVTEGGSNFSAGQRQLLALARGILRLQQSRILLLDEASASLDSKTDEQVQRTIRSEMGNATIICIAHRLSTIIDYDKILVLGGGCVLEYDSPANLLAVPESHFSALCRDGGEAEYERLKSLANASSARTPS